MNKNITFTANCINFTEKLFTENKIKFTEKRKLRFNYMPNLIRHFAYSFS